VDPERPGADNPRWLERLLEWAVYPLRSEANAFRALIAVGTTVAVIVAIVLVLRALL
jgi:hypothetical protein